MLKKLLSLFFILLISTIAYSADIGNPVVKGTLTIEDNDSVAPVNLTERSSAPSAPASGDIYLDDGSNTASGEPGLRRYTGSVWEDISSGGSGGSTVYVNTAEVSDPDFTDTATVEWTIDGSEVTANLAETYLTAEADTLDSVTGRGATTTNAVAVGGLNIAGKVLTVTDLTSDAIQTAIDALAGASGVIQLVSGTYAMTNPLTSIPNDTTIRGTGWDTVLDFSAVPNQGTATHCLAIGGSSGSLENLKIYNTLAVTNLTAPSVTIMRSVWLDRINVFGTAGLYGYYYYNCKFSYMNRHVFGRPPIHVEDCTFENFYGLIYTGSTELGATYKNCTFDLSGPNYVTTALTFSSHSVITGCKLVRNAVGHVGMSVESDSLVSGNYITANFSSSVYPIQVLGDNNIVMGNYIQNSLGNDIRLGGSASDNLLLLPDGDVVYNNSTGVNNVIIQDGNLQTDGTVLFVDKDSAGNIDSSASITSEFIDDTEGSEDSKIVLKTRTAGGVIAEAVAIESDGVTISNNGNACKIIVDTDGTCDAGTAIGVDNSIAICIVCS